MEVALEHLTNWLANKGLIVLNLGAIYVEGELDQKAFDKAIGDALLKVEAGVTPEEGKRLDAEVIKAFRKFAVLGPKP